MSGYNNETGIFELTGSKANYWLRRSDFPPECAGLSGMPLYAALLTHYGHEIVKLRESYLHVRASPGKVWEALSGRPSDPEHEAYYRRSAERQAARVAPKPDGVRRLPPAAIALFQSGMDGSSLPLEEVTASGRGACRICGQVIPKGEACLTGGYDFSGGRGGPQPTKCYLHRGCLTDAKPGEPE